MGLLDDAIREHLELKRRHGADPGEIERQEREALGATARPEAGEEPVEAADVPDETVEPAAADVAAEPEPPPTVEHEAAAPSPEEAPDDAEPPAAEKEPEPRGEADAPGYEEDPWLVEDEASGDDRRAPEDPPADQPREEDVLEETPDFLQETPEHDRLWFEQKPPRDFDWDR